MSVLILLILLLCISGCPSAGRNTTQTGSGSTSTGQQGSAGTIQDNPELALIFSGTETDQWSRDLLATIGDQLGIDPWSKPMTSGHLDLYGPYDCISGEQNFTMHVAFTGLANVVGIEGQEGLASQVLDWVDGLNAALAWLDGDTVQLQVGQQLINDMPVLFTGIVLESRLYYELGQPFTGLYKRHSMSAVFGQIWKMDHDAKQFALVTDDSNTSAVRVIRFVDIQTMLPEGCSFVVPETVHSWGELRDVIHGLDESVDAVIVTGMGQEGCSADLRENPCPPDILEGLEIPVVTLGPTMMDEAGVTSVLIDPGAHARIALANAVDILSGEDARAFATLTPEEMDLFRSEDGSGAFEPASSSGE